MITKLNFYFLFFLFIFTFACKRFETIEDNEITYIQLSSLDPQICFDENSKGSLLLI